LKWHFDYCKFHPDTIVVWEEIVKSEKAKSMWVSLKSDKDHCRVLQTMMSNSSCIGDLDINDKYGDLENIPFGNFFKYCHYCKNGLLHPPTSHAHLFILTFACMSLSNTVKSLTAYHIGHVM